MKKLKITWDEVCKHLMEFYNLKEVFLMKSNPPESDGEIIQYPSYMEGELKGVPWWALPCEKARIQKDKER